MESLLKGKKFFTFEKGLACFTGILLIMLVVFSCNNVLIRDGGSLIIALPGARATTASRFTIELTGSNGTTQSKTLAGGTTAQFDDLVPDTYSISVKGMDDAGTLVFFGTATATVIAGKTATVAVALQSSFGKLTVDFEGAESDSVTKYTVILSGPNESKETQEVDARTVQFEGLIPGDYTVSVEGKKGSDVVVLYGTSSKIPVEAGKTATAKVTLQSSFGKLTVDFEGAESDSVVKYIVTLSGPNESKETEEVDARTVQFEGLIPGDYIVRVEGKNGAEDEVLAGTSSTVTVEAGKTVTATVNLENRLGSLTVNFSGASVSSATDVVVSLKDSSDSPKSQTFPANSPVQFDDLVPGTYDIVVEGTNEAGAVIFYGTSSATVKAGETEPADVELMKGASDFASLEAAVAAGGTVYIFNNIDVESTLSVPSGITVTILPAYQDVTLKNTGSGNLFDVNSGNLTIGGGEHTITLDGNTLQHHAIYMKNTGKATLSRNAVITNCGAAGVKSYNYQTTAYFYLEGGSIMGNDGSGVEISSGSEFHMNSGVIEKNKATNGGGVYLYDGGTFILNGGSITGNNASVRGGGVNAGQGQLKMNGGDITENEAATDGGGVYFEKSIVMTGGYIGGNKSLSNSGNGVFHNGNNNGFEMSGSTVVASDNDVYLGRYKTITITGELIEDFPVATITPYTYPEATTQVQVLSLGNFTSAASKFAVTPNPADGSQWFIDTSGKLQKVAQ